MVRQKCSGIRRSYLVMEKPGIMVSIKARIPNEPNVVRLKYFNTIKINVNEPTTNIYLEARFINSKHVFI